MTPKYTRVGYAPVQPVPFSHEHHVAGLGIDCRFCHTSVEVSSNAGLPPTYTCMTCHSQIWTDAAILAPVRQSLADNAIQATLAAARAKVKITINNTAGTPGAPASPASN